jgi:hypothetical protein
MLVTNHIENFLRNEPVLLLVFKQVAHHIEVGVQEVEYGPWFGFNHFSSDSKW